MSVEQQMQCPFCGHVADRARFGFYARPEPRELYAQIYKCPRCKTWFAPIDKQPNSQYN